MTPLPARSLSRATVSTTHAARLELLVDGSLVQVAATTLERLPHAEGIVVPHQARLDACHAELAPRARVASVAVAVKRSP